jgi:transketolase
VFRPCDAVETVECWELALRDATRPSVIALTRQALPQLRLGPEMRNRCTYGAYELVAAEGKAQVSLFASGSEVAIAVEAQKQLAAKGTPARVVSVPCFELLAEAPDAARQLIVGDAPAKVAVEAAVRQGWDAIIGADGGFVGMTGFGASAPYKDLYAYFGITPEAVVEAALARLSAQGAAQPPAMSAAPAADGQSVH